MIFRWKLVCGLGSRLASARLFCLGMSRVAGLEQVGPTFHRIRVAGKVGCQYQQAVAGIQRRESSGQARSQSNQGSPCSWLTDGQNQSTHENYRNPRRHSPKLPEENQIGRHESPCVSEWLKDLGNSTEVVNQRWCQRDQKGHSPDRPPAEPLQIFTLRFRIHGGLFWQNSCRRRGFGDSLYEASRGVP